MFTRMNATVRNYPEQLAAAEDRNQLVAPLPKRVKRRGHAQRCKGARSGYLISPSIHQPFAKVGPEQNGQPRSWGCRNGRYGCFTGLAHCARLYWRYDRQHLTPASDERKFFSEAAVLVLALVLDFALVLALVVVVVVVVVVVAGVVVVAAVVVVVLVRCCLLLWSL